MNYRTLEELKARAMFETEESYLQWVADMKEVCDYINKAHDDE